MVHTPNTPNSYAGGALVDLDEVARRLEDIAFQGNHGGFSPVSTRVPTPVSQAGSLRSSAVSTPYSENSIGTASLDERGVASGAETDASAGTRTPSSVAGGDNGPGSGYSSGRSTPGSFQSRISDGPGFGHSRL